MGSRITIVAAAFAVLLAACGASDSSGHSGMHTDATAAGDSAASRKIEVTMKDVKFWPASVTVKPGETIKFVFVNQDATTHDAFIGTEAEQMEHERTMNGAPGDSMAHDGPAMDNHDAVTVAAGKSASLTHTFKPGDNVLIGCHEPGHYAAGMRLAIALA